MKQMAAKSLLVILGMFSIGSVMLTDVSATPLCPKKLNQTNQGSTIGVIDSGWSGINHNIDQVLGQKTQYKISSCDDTHEPCGVCDIDGPQKVTGEVNRSRCTNATQTVCSYNGNCTTGNKCRIHNYYIPTVAGGDPLCIAGYLTNDISGTVNLDTGVVQTSEPLVTQIYQGNSVDAPCPTCVGDTTANDTTLGGTCSGGSRNGQACDAHGISANFGSTSLDCPPNTSVLYSSTNTVVRSTNDQSLTVSTSNPNCKAVGWTTRDCLCSTCATENAEPCSTNADCPGGAACGGNRCLSGTNFGAACSASSACPGSACGVPGASTASNSCSDGICTPGGGDTGFCDQGPVDQHCLIEDFRPCFNNSQCTASGDSCGVTVRPCFTDQGVVGKRCLGGTNTLTSCTTIADCADQSAGTLCAGGAVVADGYTNTPSSNAWDAQMAAAFCMQAGSSGGISSWIGYAGPARQLDPVHFSATP